MSDDTLKTGDDAGQLFDNGLYCAESVLLALARQQGRESELVPGIATGFCSGLSQTCGPCGAVTGAVMGIGMALGRPRAGEAAGPAYRATQAFIDDFRTRFGSTNCADLLDGCDLGSPEGRQRFGAEKLIGRCRSYTATAADLAVQAIDKAKAG